MIIKLTFEARSHAQLSPALIPVANVGRLGSLAATFSPINAFNCPADLNQKTITKGGARRRQLPSSP